MKTAVVRDIKRNNIKKIAAKSNTVLDYGMNSHYFAVWTYRESDQLREIAPSQNIQLDKKMATIMRDALDEFINGGK